VPKNKKTNPDLILISSVALLKRVKRID